MKNKLILSIALFVSLPFAGQASEDAGLPGDFLNSGVGSRALGMGRAFTAVSDDVDAIYYNPSGLATFRASQLTFQHSPLPIGGAYQYLAYSSPLYALGALGVAIVNLDSGDVDRVDSNNIVIGQFEARETAYMASYAHRMGDKLSLGGTLKMAENSIDGRSERGFGADVGGMYKLNERVKFGGTIRNLIPPTYSFNTEKEQFPIIARAGTAVKWFDGHLTTALDLSKTIDVDQGVKYHFGLEGFVIKNIFLRAGLDSDEITTGVGIRFRNLQFDYAIGFNDLDSINRFSAKVFFGGYNVDVKANPTKFSPIGLKNKVTFNIKAANRSRIVKWILSIRNGKGDVIQSFQGFNAPPKFIEWDGRDAQGDVVKPGRYTFRMVITDTKKRVEKTPRRSLSVVAPSPFEIEAR